MRRLISSKTLWGLHIAQGRAMEISAWAAANGLDPGDVSTQHDLIVDATAKPALIRYTAYRRALDGSKYQEGDMPAVEERTMPLAVEPPEHWPTWALADEGTQP